MLIVSFSRPVELDQTLSPKIQNQKNNHIVARVTCVGGKRHILRLAGIHKTFYFSLGPWDFKVDFELQTWEFNCDKFGKKPH